MIRLNDHLLAGAAGCEPMETHFMGLKLQLWPTFQRQLHAEHHQLSLTSVPLLPLATRYASLVSTLVGMSDPTAEPQQDKVLAELLRLRETLDGLVLASTHPICPTIIKELLVSGSDFLSGSSLQIVDKRIWVHVDSLLHTWACSS